jgi:translation initiation factor IF-2
MQKALDGMLEPVEKEVVVGNAEVRKVFKVSKVGVIAGSYVTAGLIRRGLPARLLREGVEVAESKVSSLKRLKDDAAEVGHGLECGIGLENFNDVKEGDVIEVFEVRREKAKVR